MPTNSCSFCGSLFERAGVEVRRDQLVIPLGPVAKLSRGSSHALCARCALDLRGAQDAVMAREQAAAKSGKIQKASAAPRKHKTQQDKHKATKEEDDDSAAAAAHAEPYTREHPYTRIEMYYLGWLEEPLEDCERENKCGPGVCEHNPEDLRYGMNPF